MQCEVFWEIQCATSSQVISRSKVQLELCKPPDFRVMVIYEAHVLCQKEDLYMVEKG